MKKRLVSLADVYDFLREKLDEVDALFDAVADARGKGPHALKALMELRASALAPSSAVQVEAEHWLNRLNNDRHPDGNLRSDEDRFKSAVEEVSDYFLRRYVPSTADGARSGSNDLPAVKQGEHDFYLEFYRRLHFGY